MISITNAGRGAGKTYQLVQWAKESPNRFVIGLYASTGDAMEEAGLWDQFVHYVHAKTFFQGRHDYEVAIDDLQRVLDSVLYDQFGIHSAEYPTIITMTLPEAGMTSAKDTGTKLLPEYAANLLAMYGDKK